jgi:hypothetical protein
MKKTILFSALIAVGSLGFAATASAQDYTCDLVEKGGTWAAKYRARVVRQSVNSTIVQWQLPDGSWTAAQRRFPARDATAEMGGQSVRISDLPERQEVNVYMPLGGAWTLPVEEATAAAAPPPPPPPPPPAPEPEEEPEALPTTATQVPAFALLGGLLLLLGGAVSFVRTRL